MDAIHAGVPFEDVPEWATLERQLLRFLSDAVEPTMETYYADGELAWPENGGGLDDAYECFSNLPLVYALGGDEIALETAIDHWEHVTERFMRGSDDDSAVAGDDEYFGRFDWMHMGEGNQLFYHICLAAPEREAFRDRAQRFADLYMPDGPGNYDPDRRMIPAPNSGTDGAGDRMDYSTGWGYYGWKDPYDIPFTDIDGVETVEDLKDPDKAEAMGEALEERWGGDTAVNLAATSLVTNAFLATGDERYRQWVREYVDAWSERTERNGGIVPDNVGPSGEIGELLDGKWYGNYYGWTWPHGWWFIGEATVTAGENVALLDGDDSYFEMTRSTIDALTDVAIERSDVPHVPYKHGDEGTYAYDPHHEDILEDEAGNVLWRDGWFEFRPMDPRYLTHLWLETQDAADMDRWRRLHGDAVSGAELTQQKKDAAGNDGPWVQFLRGENPDYPERILTHCLGHGAEKLALARERGPEYVPPDDEFLNRDSPFDVEGLIQCTMGGPMPLYNGGLLRTRVRHFDPERERPGLPPDVAALVTGLTEDRTDLELVNLGAKTRTVAVQAGTYGEHRFEEISYDVGTNDGRSSRVQDIEDRAVSVSLPGCTRTSIELRTDRYAGVPTHEPPWERQ